MRIAAPAMVDESAIGIADAELLRHLYPAANVRVFIVRMACPRWILTVTLLMPNTGASAGKAAPTIDYPMIIKRRTGMADVARHATLTCLPL